MHHHSCVSGVPSTTTATIWSAGLRAASAIRPPILDQAEILYREEVLMTDKISATAKAFTTRRSMRLQKAVVFKNFAAKTKNHTKAISA
jgi:hypothetical protein